MRAWFAVALLLPCLAVAATPGSPAQVWPIDPARSEAQFSVRKFWFAHVRGTFPGLHGTLQRIDTRLGVDLAKVDATLAVADLEMDDAGDREHALGPGFFDAAQFPTVRFDAEPFPLAKLVSGGALRGVLALHGEQSVVEFELLPSDCPREPLECGIRVRGSISRSAFGMRKWRGVLSDKVELDLQIALRTVPDAHSPESSPGTG